jgi:hypothetical protein
VRRVALAIGLGLAVVLAGAVVALSLRAPRLSATNSHVEASLVDVPVLGGARRCQRDEFVPAATGAMRLFVNTKGRPAGPVEIVVIGTGRPGSAPAIASRASIAFPVREGSISPVLRPTVRRDLRGASLCVINRGRSPVYFAGNKSPLGIGANPGQQVHDDDVRVDYLYPGKRSWWSMAGPVAERFGLAKASFFGSWTLWAVLGVVAALWVGTVVLLVKWVRPA